jgi:hypothetical protein
MAEQPQVVPQVEVFSFVYKGEIRYTVQITTPHQQSQVGISPQGRRITMCQPHKTPSGHWKEI